jgi:transporter family-2 protein
LQPLKDVHPLLLTAGVLGACLVFAIAWLIPQVGAGPVMITLLAGQVIGGLVMSHFGWLGSPVQPVTLAKIAGVLIMIGGVTLATYAK